MHCTDRYNFIAIIAAAWCPPLASAAPAISPIPTPAPPTPARPIPPRFTPPLPNPPPPTL